MVLKKALSKQLLPLTLDTGEIIITQDPAIVSARIDGGIALCVFSVKGQCGGISHFILPHSPAAAKSHAAKNYIYRYGDAAAKALIEGILSLPGIHHKDLRAKIIGGSLKAREAHDAARNLEVARQVLAHYKIPLIGEDTGGHTSRKVFFYTDTGRVRVNQVDKATHTSSALKEKGSREAVSPSQRKIKVLVVDDSKVIQEVLSTILSQAPNIEVLGTAAHPLEAEAILAREKPDVITLDIHMPHMDGVTFLAKLMEHQPIPVIMITAMSLEDGDEVIRALELGAVDYIQKPKAADLRGVAPLICEKVQAAASAKIRRKRASNTHIAPGPKIATGSRGRSIIAIGASTGGTEAIKEVLLSLSADIPPIVIVQHIPAVFSKAFANRLNDLCPFTVKEAEHGDLLLSGRVLLAPGGLQMSIEPDALGYKVKLSDAPPINRHKPSVDVLFESVARYARGKALGILLTGMGSDGAKGLHAMKEQNCLTIAQDEKSCVVFGMPKEAIRMGAASEVLDLEAIPRKIESWRRAKRSQA